MREIKFRGKDSSSQEWVYGDLKHGIVRPYINTSVGCIPVDVDTIGQYTELKDKHGSEIYEGDIVRVDDICNRAYFTPYKGVVVSRRGCWCVSHYDKTFQSYSYRSLFFDDFADRKTEIIGNLYDNPELLK